MQRPSEQNWGTAVVEFEAGLESVTFAISRNPSVPGDESKRSVICWIINLTSKIRHLKIHSISA